MLNLVTKNPDIIRAKLIFAGDALFQSSLLEALGSVLERLRSISEPI